MVKEIKFLKGNQIRNELCLLEFILQIDFQLELIFDEGHKLYVCIERGFQPNKLKKNMID